MGNILVSPVVKWHCCTSRKTQDRVAQGRDHFTIGGETLNFPNGVFCEVIKDGWLGANVGLLLDHSPPAVYEVIEKALLQDVYTDFKNKLADTPKIDDEWNCEEIKCTVEGFAPQFSSKGVDIFMCVDTTDLGLALVSLGKRDLYGDNKWIVYIDRSEAPDYQPKYIWDGTFPGLDLYAWRTPKVRVDIRIDSGDLPTKIEADESWQVLKVKQTLQEKLPPARRAIFLLKKIEGGECLLNDDEILAELGLTGKVELNALIADESWQVCQVKKTLQERLPSGSRVIFLLMKIPGGACLLQDHQTVAKLGLTGKVGMSATIGDAPG